MMYKSRGSLVLEEASGTPSKNKHLFECGPLDFGGQQDVTKVTWSLPGMPPLILPPDLL